MNSDLLNISLNALKTLQTVYRVGSVSGAAVALNVQQPSVSYTLDRLRGTLDDPLFLRQGRGIAPTDRCKELMPVVDRILAEADHLGNETFNPATYDGTVKLMMSGFILGILIPGILRRLEKKAPKLKLKVDLGHGSAADTLLGGKADIVLSLESPNVTGVYSELSFLSDVGVCIMDASNPLANRQLTLEDLKQARFVLASPTPNYVAPFVSAAAAAGIEIEPVTVVNDVGVTPSLIKGTDMLGGVPSRMAVQYAPALATARWPFKLIAEWNMHWAATAHRSPLNIWMRKLILEEAAKLGPPIDP